MRYTAIALIAAGLGIGIGQAATAADLPAAPAPVYRAPVVARAYDWSGIYIGINGGGAWSRSNLSTSTVFDPAGYFVEASVSAVNAAGAQTIDATSFLGGAQVGYNVQSGRFVAGLEFDFDYFRLRGSSTTTGVYPCCAPAGFTISSSVRADWLATLRGRAGVAAANWLFYATGGLAVANVKGNFAFTDNCGDVVVCNGPGGPNAFEAASVSKVRFGYAVGGGAEAGLWGSWSLKAEYLYVAFRSESVTGRITTPAIAPFAINNPFTHTADLKAHVARLGLNYRFGGPMVASY
jgi:outer membrane immunogenic protein